LRFSFPQGLKNLQKKHLEPKLCNRAWLQPCRKRTKTKREVLGPEGISCQAGMNPQSIRLGLGIALLAAGLMSFPSWLLAQAPPLTAHDLAERVDRHYNRLHSLKAGFTETYEGLGMKRTESGTLLLLKPSRMKWDYSSPPGKLFLLDGSFAWFYAQGDPQVQRIPAKELDDLRSPMSLLLGHTKLEKELENITAAPGANGQFTLTGVPKGLEKRVARLALTVTAEGTITSIEIEETDGAVTHFTFTGEEPDAPIPPGTFRFRPPTGVPVVDALPPA
jgi:outer membrane lipoprotein carrier protein